MGTDPPRSRDGELLLVVPRGHGGEGLADLADAGGVYGFSMFEADLELPAIPVSAGGLIFDRAGRLLILKPTYKSGWTIPGGVMEADGETPWQACRREVREETGIEVREGRLACMDFRRPRPGKPGGIRFLFDCGAVDDEDLAAITVQAAEVSEYRFTALPEALPLLRKPIRRRVRAATGGRRLVYLEDGRPVPGVGRPLPRPGTAAADSSPPSQHGRTK